MFCAEGVVIPLGWEGLLAASFEGTCVVIDEAEAAGGVSFLLAADDMAPMSETPVTVTRSSSGATSIVEAPIYRTMTT